MVDTGRMSRTGRRGFGGLIDESLKEENMELKKFGDTYTIPEEGAGFKGPAMFEDDIYGNQRQADELS